MGSVTGGWLKLVTGVPLKAQVSPCWIDGNNQCNLSAPKPAFDLLLAPQDDPLRDQDGRVAWPESVTNEHSREQSCAKPRELAIPVIRNRQYCHPERRLWPRRTYVIAGSAKAVGGLHRPFGPKMPGIRMTRTTFTKVTSTLTCEIYNISISSY